MDVVQRRRLIHLTDMTMIKVIHLGLIHLVRIHMELISVALVHLVLTVYTDLEFVPRMFPPSCSSWIGLVTQHKIRSDGTEQRDLDTFDLEEVVKAAERALAVPVHDDVLSQVLRNELDLHQLKDVGRVDVDLRGVRQASLTSSSSCSSCSRAKGGENTTSVIRHREVDSTARR